MALYFELEDSSGVIPLEVGPGNLLLDLITPTLLRHIKTSQSNTENAKTTVNLTVVAVLQ